MKIKNILAGLLLALSMGSIMLLVSCADDLDIGKPIDESAYDGVYENTAYLRDGKSNRIFNMVELYDDVYTTTVKLGLSKTPSKSTKAKVKIDTEYLAVYNLEHETEFEIYPQDHIIFENDGLFVIEDELKFAETAMTIKGSDKLSEEKTYAIPLAITDYSGDISESDVKHCIYLVKDMRNVADAYKGEDVVKGAVYFEVNNVNPLNALAFELENGKLLWDAVILFSANINYDSEAGRPYVQCNPNVQYLLDNNEIFIQPLRKRGIKVILGLLGNHDMTGLAQLSAQGAKDFAREVAQYCKAYNLDGVNFDDEWSKNPDLSNPALTERSGEAAARLCYETKRMMPDKLVTVFAYGPIYSSGIASVNDVKAEQYIDVVLPNYFGGMPPLYGGLTRKQFAGISAEYNEGIGGSLTLSEAKRIQREGYGWHMGFDLKPTNFTYAVRRLSGAEALYDSKLKPISTYYRKNDINPYNYLTDTPVVN